MHRLVRESLSEQFSGGLSSHVLAFTVIIRPHYRLRRIGGDEPIVLALSTARLK